MLKKELLAMQKLKPSSTMLRMAKADEPQITKHKSYYGSVWEERKYNTAVYFRCCTKNGILKLSCFLAEDLRTGKSKPLYEIYFSRQENTYLTYDTQKDRWLTGSFRRLQWPSYYECYYSLKYWCSRETRKTICRYFDKENQNIIDVISKFQNGIMDERLKAKHKKETDPWDEDLKQTPVLPKDFDKWVDKHGIPENYIFYKYSKTKKQTGYCTFCENEVCVSAKHNVSGTCPHCHKKVVFKALGRFKRFCTDEHMLYLMQKCKDGFMIRRFRAYKRFTSKDYKTPEIRCFEGRRVIGNKAGVLMRAYYYGDYKKVCFRWIECEIRDYSSYWDCCGAIYKNNLSALFAKELKTTGLKEYYRLDQYCDIEKYLSAYSEMPYIEKFIKVGLIRLVDEISNCTRRRHSSHCYTKSELFDKEQSSVIKVLKLTPSAYRRLVARNGGKDILVWLQLETRRKKEIPDVTLDWLIDNSITPSRFSFIGNKMSIEQIAYYIKKQMSESNMTLHEVLTTWEDYLDMAKKLGYDTNDEIVYRTKKLKQRHDELVDIINGEDDAKKAVCILKSFPKVEYNMAAVKEKYEFSNKDYTIIVPTKIEQILSEGRALHHCVDKVDKYWDRIDKNETLIFFLRKTSNLNEAYYTLEVEHGGTVRQKRTMYDNQNDDIEDASEFLRLWQKEIQKRLTDKDRKLAQRSRVLRLEELNELEEKNIRINTGKLQGQRLLDVLMADLMEAA